jgi:hypothetical protein
MGVVADGGGQRSSVPVFQVAVSVGVFPARTWRAMSNDPW